MKLSLTFGKRLWLLALLMILGLSITGGLQLLLARLEIPLQAQLRIATIVQQLLAFMLPAVIAAMLSTRLPAQLLGVDRAPDRAPFLWALFTFVVSIPAMNLLVHGCELLPWPEGIRAAEETNRQMSELIIGEGSSALQTLLAVCVVGIMPGLCEELFFRGALQNLLRSRPMSVHAAIWITSALFSLMHAQPIGFLPRMLLGAGFGYAAVCTRSLWTAVAIHMLNNSLIVITQRAGEDSAAFGLSSPALCVISLILTALGLSKMWGHYSRFMSRGI